MVPVTQYVPTYEVEQVPITVQTLVPVPRPVQVEKRIIYEHVPAPPQIIEQRIIRNEPCEVYEETKYIEETKVPVPETYIETVQYHREESRSYRPSVVVQKNDNSCCSPLLLCLLGLLALGGILSAILLGAHNNSNANNANNTFVSEEGSQQNQTTSVVEPIQMTLVGKKITTQQETSETTN